MIAMMSWAMMIHMRRRPMAIIVNRSMMKPSMILRLQGSAVIATTWPTSLAGAPLATSQMGMANMKSPIGTPCAK